MTLPSTFLCPESYLEECLSFFQEYQHLYIYPNTDILISNVLDEIHIKSPGFTNIFDENVTSENLAGSIEYLDKFFSKLKRLEPMFSDFKNTEDRIESRNAPLGPKKKHEIMHLSREINNVCKEAKCEVVVDFGSGLGYLDQLIFETSQLKVLGIECNENHYVGAKKRQRKYHNDSLEHVKYIKQTITHNSGDKIEEYLEDKFGLQPFCITGLHACADLAVDATRLFLNMQAAKAMLIMPCCYHKMMKVADGSRMINFPLSRNLQNIFEERCSFEYINVPFMRLGAQPPSRNDEKLRESVFNLLARAVLQLYAQKHEWTLKRNKRKAVRVKNMENDFTKYIEHAAKGFNIIRQSLEKDNEEILLDVKELENIWREIDDLTFQKAAIFVLLQNSLQPVIENFILYDRLLFLRENGVECKYKKIFDNTISPRCLALLAFK